MKSAATPFPFMLPAEDTKKTTAWDDIYPVLVKEDSNIITIFISDRINEPFEFNKMVYVLNSLTPEHQVIMHINTYGGIIDSANMLCYAMRNCKAPIHGVLTGTVGSAGTIIALSCTSIEVSEGCSFMIHNYSAGIEGKGHEIKAHQKFMDAELNTYFSLMYDKFLTPEEIKDVIDGKDLWMGKEEVMRRWANKLA